MCDSIICISCPFIPIGISASVLASLFPETDLGMPPQTEKDACREADRQYAKVNSGRRLGTAVFGDSRTHQLRPGPMVGGIGSSPSGGNGSIGGSG